MFGSTRRTRMAFALIALLGIATMAAAALGWERAALTGLAAGAFLGVGLLLALYLRDRGRAERHHHTTSKTQTSILRRLEAIEAADAADRAAAAALEAAAPAAAQPVEMPRVDTAAVARIAELEQALESARRESARLDDLSRASYRLSLRQHVRILDAEREMRPVRPSALLQLPFKLRTMEFAASHGVQIPEILEVWPTLEEVDLRALPDQFVLKADGGAGSQAVFPLQRDANLTYRVIGTERAVTQEELIERFRSLGGRARAPFFAEELLLAPDGQIIPDDVKLYMFYGEVGQILVRNVGKHGDNSTIRPKFVDEEGRDFGSVSIGRKNDPTVPVPAMLSEMVSASKHLSRAVGLPFCRVDLYETTRGVVMGEITQAPSGGNERFVATHDELLGRTWIRAQARLAADLAAGRPVGALFGTQADLHLYPSGVPHRTNNFGRNVVGCSQWCAAD
jgi:hypothetical protein